MRSLCGGIPQKTGPAKAGTPTDGTPAGTPTKKTGAASPSERGPGNPQKILDFGIGVSGALAAAEGDEASETTSEKSEAGGLGDDRQIVKSPVVGSSRICKPLSAKSVAHTARCWIQAGKEGL